jgi:hypothetical protein
MTVYAVVWQWGHCTDLAGVFATLEEAERCVEEGKEGSEDAYWLVYETKLGRHFPPMLLFIPDAEEEDDAL